MNLGPNDRSIHVYHFTKEIAQNQVVFQPSFNSMSASTYGHGIQLLIKFFLFPSTASPEFWGSIFLGHP